MPKPEVIIVEKPFRGRAPAPGGFNNVIEGPENSYTTSSCDVLRPGKEFHIAPGHTYSNITDSSNRINEVPLNATVTSNGEAWVVLRNSRLVKFGLTDDIVDANYDITLSGSHSAHSSVTTSDYPDVISFTDSSGNEKVAWSWQDSTDGDIATINSDGSSQDDDWFSTLTGSGALEKDVPLKLFKGPDGFIYSTNGQYIAQHDPSTSNGNNQALDLGPGWVATSGQPFNDYIAVIAYTDTSFVSGLALGEVRLYLWDGFSPKPNFIIPIKDNYSGALFNHNGILHIFTSGRSGTNKCWLYAGGREEQLAWERRFSEIGQMPQHGQVEVVRNKVHFLTSAALRAMDGPAFYDRGNTGANNIGMLSNLQENNLYIGASSDIKKDNLGEYETSVNHRTVLFPLSYQANITKIVVFFSQFSTDSSVILSLFKNYNNVAIGGANDLLNYTIDNDSHPEAADEKSVVIKSMTIPDLSSFFMNFSFNHSQSDDEAAIIRAVLIYVSPSNKG